MFDYFVKFSKRAIPADRVEDFNFVSPLSDKLREDLSDLRWLFTTDNDEEVIVFKHESSNETEVVAIFRKLVSGLVPSGAAWTSPVRLDKDHSNWMPENFLASFEKARAIVQG